MSKASLFGLASNLCAAFDVSVDVITESMISTKKFIVL